MHVFSIMSLFSSYIYILKLYAFNQMETKLKKAFFKDFDWGDESIYF